MAPFDKRRRQFLSTTLHAAGAIALGGAPAIVRQDAARPAVSHGGASGDVSGDRAIVWCRSDRPARLRVEWSTTESFRTVRRVDDPEAVARTATGLTARIDLTRLPRGQRIFYRLQLEDLFDARNVSLPASGHFLAAPHFARDIRFAWSADTVGQGWGINPAWGGLRMYDTMRRAQPDFFIHCGDTIYADAPVPPELPLPDGSIWKNIVTPAKSKVAETIDEFRGNYLYNLLDDHLRRFNAEVPQIMLWDDHEVRNNWFPTMSLAADARYTIKDPAILAANARQAFLEHTPIRLATAGPTRIYRACEYGPLLDVFALDLRTYRGPNSPNRQTAATADSAIAGAEQITWLKTALTRSRATWKVIASDLPIGLVVPDQGIGLEAIANGDGGPPLGRELEIADLLAHISQQRIRNVVWLTADVHYAAAHHYNPEQARFKGFSPFWEFVAGPLHAVTGPPSALDDTFGPEVRYISVPPNFEYTGPSAGLQFFGLVTINGRSRAMNVQLRNLDGTTVFAVDLEPER